MPPKVKKGLKEVITTVNIVKQYWGDYPITQESIRNPTRDFVIKLYTTAVENIDAKIAFATRTQLLPHPPGLGEEELLFLKLSRIPALVKADFKLGDLYIFDPIRVRSYIHIIMHFLMFTDTAMDETVQICNGVFEAKEKMERNQEELRELKQEKLNKQIQLTEAKTEKKKLKDEAAGIAPDYEATVALIEETENKCRGKIEEVDKMKNELDNVQEEVQQLEKTQSYLKNQIVTDEEYSSLKNCLETLKTEEKNLEEIDVNNGLFEQKHYLEKLQMCLRKLNQLELSEDLFKLSHYRGELKDQQASLQYALNLHKNSRAEIDDWKLRLENEREAVEVKKKELEDQLQTITEQGLIQKNKKKKKNQQIMVDYQLKIKTLRSLLEEREADCIRLEKELKGRYDAICQKQDMILAKFTQYMDKVNKVIKDKNFN